MAGESARELARKHREKSELHARMAALYERGAVGEAATGVALDDLATEGWFTLHDVAWPGRPRANIDHVVVGPGGVLVVDSKNWSGRVTVEGGVLRQNGYQRPAAIAGVQEAARAVSEVLGGMPVTGVLCMTSGLSAAATVDGVVVCGTDRLRSVLLSQPPALVPQRVVQVRDQLSASLPPRTAAEATKIAQPSMRMRTSPTSSTPRRVPRPRTRSRHRRRSGAGAIGRFVVVVVVACVGVAMLLAHGSTIAGWVGAQVESSLSPIEPVGASLQVARDGDRPPLTVRVKAVRQVSSTQSNVRSRPGHHLVAARVVVHNRGARQWQQPKIWLRAETDLAGTLEPARRFRAIDLGKVWRYGKPVPAREIVAGLVVFEVPMGAQVDVVRARLGGGADLRWRAD